MVGDFQQEGLRVIREGKAAVVILAGGQGSRLGFEHPKGMYVMQGLPSGKSIFQILTERFLKSQMIAHGITSLGELHSKVCCKMLVMTSLENHEETVEYFKSNSYFGGD